MQRRSVFLCAGLWVSTGCAGGSQGSTPGDDTGLPEEVVEQASQLRVDAADGLPRDPDSRDVQLCALGSQVLAAWVDDRDGAPAVWANRSEDGGLTWAEQALAISRSPGAAAAPSLACDGSRAWIAWTDTRDSEFERPSTWLSASGDSGASWDSPRRLDIQGVTDQGARAPHVQAEGADVLVTWAANPFGGFDIFAAVSHDGGGSFSIAQRLDSGDDAGASYSANPQAVFTDDAVLVAFEDRRDGVMNILAVRSEDRGDSFGAEQTLSGAPGDALGVRLAASGTRAWATWHQGPSDARLDVYVSAMTDGSWSGAERVSGGEAGQRDDVRPRIAAAGDTAHLVWFSEARGGYEVRHQPISGGSPASEPARVDRSTDGVYADRPSVAAQGDVVLVAWEDDRNASEADDTDVFIAWSTDGGTSWSEDQRINPAVQAVAAATDLQVVMSGDTAWVGWADRSLGTFDIYVAPLSIPSEGGAR